MKYKNDLLYVIEVLQHLNITRDNYNISYKLAFDKIVVKDYVELKLSTSADRYSIFLTTTTDTTHFKFSKMRVRQKCGRKIPQEHRKSCEMR